MRQYGRWVSVPMLVLSKEAVTYDGRVCRCRELVYGVCMTELLISPPDQRHAK